MDTAADQSLPVRHLRALQGTAIEEEHWQSVLRGYQTAHWVLDLDKIPGFPALADLGLDFDADPTWHPMTTHQGVRMRMLYPQRPNRDQWKLSWLEFRSRLDLEDYKAVMESSSVRFQWDPALKGVQVLDSYGVSVLVRSQIKGFWPVVGDRDLAIIMTCLANDTGTAWLSMAHSVVDDVRIPPNSSNVRAHCTLAAFLLEYVHGLADEENHPDGRLIRLTYVTQSDPRGMIPENVLTMLAHSQAQCVANIAQYLNKAVPPPQVWSSMYGKFAGIDFNIKLNQFYLDFMKEDAIPDGKRISVLLRIGTQLETVTFKDTQVEYVFYRFVYRGHHFVWIFMDPKSLKADQVYRVTITQSKSASVTSTVHESVELAEFVSNSIHGVHELWWNPALPDQVWTMLSEAEAKIERRVETPPPVMFDPRDQERVNALLAQYAHLQAVDTDDRTLRAVQLLTDAPVLAVAQWLAMDPNHTMSDLTHSYLTAQNESISKSEVLKEPPVLLRMGISQYSLTHRRGTGNPTPVSTMLKFFSGSDSIKHVQHEWWRLIKWIQMHGQSWKTLVVWQPDFIAKAKSRKGDRSSAVPSIMNSMGSSVGFIIESGENGNPQPGAKITVLSGKHVDLEAIQKFLGFMGRQNVPYLEYPLPNTQTGEHEWKHCLVIHRVQILYQSDITPAPDRDRPDQDNVVGIRFQCSIQQHATVSAPVFERIRTSKTQPWVYYHMLTLNFPIKDGQQRHIRMQSSHSLLSAYVQCVYEQEKVFILFTDMKNRLPSGHDHSMALELANPALFPMDLEIDAFFVKNGPDLAASQASLNQLANIERFDVAESREWVYVNGVPIHSLHTFHAKDGAMFPDVISNHPEESAKKSVSLVYVLTAGLSFLVGVLSKYVWMDAAPVNHPAHGNNVSAETGG